MNEINKTETENENVGVEENKSQEPINREQAEMQIRAILQNMALMGGVSNEPSNIHDILRQLDEGSISPDTAIIMAREVENGRQENYH